MDCNYFDKSNEQIKKKIKKQKQQITVSIHQVGKLRCELSYRRCETSVEDLLNMIRFVSSSSPSSSLWGWKMILIIINNILIIVNRVEVDEIENIQKEVENDAIDLDSVAERWVLMTVLLGGRCHWAVWWSQWLWIRNNANNLDTTKTVPMWAALRVLLLDFLRFNLKSQLSRSMPSMPRMEEETRLSWNHT